MSFAELGLGPELLKAVEEAGYSTPTPIQSQAIPVVLMGRDVLGVAQTGTGKTAGFTLPMIEILAGSRAKARMPRSLILAPTRELASQVAENFEKYGKYHRLTMAKLIGGESFVDQEKLLDRGVDVLIATPGRLMDLFDRGRILLNDVKILVIDEADRMLDMGFIPDVERIVSMLPKIRQTLFFSATMAPEIRRLADAFLMNPKEISVAPAASTASTVSPFLVICDEMDKREALRHLIRVEEVKSAFIFCNRKRDVDILYRSLAKHGFDVGQLHGDMAQSARTETLDRFRRGEVRLMCCSDVAARGIDISDLSHVFNFDVPHHSEDYVHRIGRTGRAGKEGRAFTIATPYDAKFVAAISKLIGKDIPQIVVEGLPERALDASSEAAPRRGGRNSKRSAGGPARSKTESAAPRRNSDANAAKPVERAATPERAVERPPERQAERPPERQPERQAERPPERSSERQERPRDRYERPRRGRWEDEIGEVANPDNVVGFGVHMPDFIRVDPRLYSKALSDDAAGEIAAPPVKAAEIIEIVSAPVVETLSEPVAEMVAEATGETAPDAAIESKPKRRRRKPAGGEPSAA
jgi:superfamily II DNA/RNA helicase